MKGLMTSGYRDSFHDKVIICHHITIKGLKECEEGYGDQSGTIISIECKECNTEFPFSFEEFR